MIWTVVLSIAFLANGIMLGSNLAQGQVFWCGLNVASAWLCWSGIKVKES
jgi:hypothetical protein